MGRGPVGHWGGGSFGNFYDGGGKAMFTVGVKIMLIRFFSFLRNFGECFCNIYNFVTPIRNFYGGS